jgi:hypothetical protein
MRFEMYRSTLRGDCAVTAHQFEKLTRAILISVAVALAACLAWELRAATFEYLVECEHENLCERKKTWDEIVRHNLEMQSQGVYFGDSLTSDEGPSPDVW